MCEKCEKEKVYSKGLCKKCYNRKYREEHKTQIKEYEKHRDKEKKAEYDKKRDKKKLAEYNKKYNKEHRKEINEKHRIYMKTYIKSSKQIEEAEIYSKKYHKEHKEEYRLRSEKYNKENKDKLNKQMKEHYKNNKDYYNERNMKRRRNIEIIEHVDKGLLIFSHQGECPYCGKNLVNDATTHVDHLIPVIRYVKLGKKCPHKYSTVVPTCAECNLSKNDRTPLEFIWAKI